MKTFSYGLALFIFWLLLSGQLEPLLLGLGLASVAFTVFLAKRMSVFDSESYPLHLFPRFPVFIAYLSWEIVKANLDVIKRIMTFNKLSISPQWFEVPLPQKTDLGRVIYANSITLTPGTVSVDLTQDKIVVHALTKEAADDLSTGVMAKQVQAQLAEN